MAGVAKLKRELLQDLVQENLELRQGQAAVAVRRAKGSRRRFQAGAVFSVLLCVTLFGSSGLLTSAAVEPTPAKAVLASAALARRPPVAKPVRFTPGPRVDATVFPLAVRKIVIDAGHGGGSFGTKTPLGLVEKDVTLDIAERLERLLVERKSFDVLMTRHDDREVSLAERCAFANRAGADLFISIHVNWLVNREARGVETYYLGPTDDPFLTRLAASENRDSGYSMTDMRRLLDGIYADVRHDKSRKFAQTLQASLWTSLVKVNPQLADRGVKTAPFIVLLSTEMPAVLAEVSCLSNSEEAGLLAKPLYRQYIAEALAAGLRSYAAAAQGASEKGI